MKDNSFRLRQFNFSSSTFEIVKFKSIDTFPRQEERYVLFFSTSLLQLARLNSEFLTFSWMLSSVSVKKDSMPGKPLKPKIHWNQWIDKPTV